MCSDKIHWKWKGAQGTDVPKRLPHSLIQHQVAQLCFTAEAVQPLGGIGLSSPTPEGGPGPSAVLPLTPHLTLEQYILYLFPSGQLSALCFSPCGFHTQACTAAMRENAPGAFVKIDQAYFQPIQYLPLLFAGLCWYLPLGNPFSGWSRVLWTHPILSCSQIFPGQTLPFYDCHLGSNCACLVVLRCSGFWFLRMRVVEGPLNVSAQLLMPTHPGKEFLPYSFIPPHCDWLTGGYSPGRLESPSFLPALGLSPFGGGGCCSWDVGETVASR